MSINLKEKAINKNCLSIKVLFSHGNGQQPRPVGRGL